MSDTPETQPVEGVEILKLLREINAQARANGSALSSLDARVQAIEAQMRTSAPATAVTGLREQLADMHRILTEAEPLLHSGPARALRGTRRVTDYLKAGGSRG